MTGEPQAEVLASGLTFLESPRWHQGRLWVSDFFSGRVLAFSADGTAETMAELPGDRPSGLGWDTAGRLVISSMTDRRLLRLEDGELTPLAELRDHVPWHCNDIAVDRLGGVYVGNFGWDDEEDTQIRPTHLLRVTESGEVAVVAHDLVFPNGIVLSEDQRTVYVAETFAARVTAFDRSPDGSLSGSRTWAGFAPPGGFATTTEACASGAPLPDGMALDASGAMWMGDAAGTGALRVAEGGEVLQRVGVDDEQTVFAVALGGTDGRTLFVCAADPYGVGDPRRERRARLLRYRVDVPAPGYPR